MKFDIFKPIILNELGQRENQEDTVLPTIEQATEQNRLFLVCDGMGGHSKGEVASSVVCDTISKWLASHAQDGIVDDDTIRDAIDQAHRELNKRDDGAVQKMGTTLTLLSLHNGGVTMGHIGDSRIYHIRPSSRQILYKSIDHSLVYDMFRSGEITYDEMASSSRRNVITRAMMPGTDNEVDIDITHTTDVKPGDYFYLCSDGMLEQMSDAQLLDLLCAEGSDEKKASLLKSSTLDNKDNHSAILVKLKGVASEVGDEHLLNDEAHSRYNEVALLASMAQEESEQNVISVPMDPEPQPESEPELDMTHDDLSDIVPVNKKSSLGKLVRYLLLFLLLALLAAAAYYIFMVKGNDEKKGEPTRVENVSAPQQSEGSNLDAPKRHTAAPGSKSSTPSKQQDQKAAPNNKDKEKNPAGNKGEGTNSAKKLDKAIKDGDKVNDKDGDKVNLNKFNKGKKGTDKDNNGNSGSQNSKGTDSPESI